MVTFDGANKLIICGAGTTTLSVKEMYSMWKEWMVLSDNSKYEPAFKVVGGEPTTGNNIITPYFFLSNGWKIRPQESNHTLRVDGILITDDGSDAFVDTLGVFRVGIQSIVPIYTESVLINTDGGAIQNIPTPSEIADRVWNNSTRELTTSTGIDEVELHTALDNYTNKDDWKATDTVVNLQPVLDAINALNNLSLPEVEGSTVLAKSATQAVIQGLIEGQNDITAADVRAAFNEADFKDKNTEAELHAWLNSYANKNEWKANLATVEGKIDSIPHNVWSFAI